MFPGPGIGGYCLPKNGGLSIWAYKHNLGWEDDMFRITPMAININETRALYVPQLVRDALRNMSKPIAAAEVLLLGASYKEDVGDTRYSGWELIVRRKTEMGAEVKAHDPYVQHCWEFENQDNYPASDFSKARFFHRQDKLKNLRMEDGMWQAMKGVDVMVLAMRHKLYLALDPEKVYKSVGKLFTIIDCF
jgi:UDP-N-acetyl-D-mannosaminuronate dehydrogenase